MSRQAHTTCAGILPFDDAAPQLSSLVHPFLLDVCPVFRGTTHQLHQFSAYYQWRDEKILKAVMKKCVHGVWSTVRWGARLSELFGNSNAKEANQDSQGLVLFTWELLVAMQGLAIYIIIRLDDGETEYSGFDSLLIVAVTVSAVRIRRSVDWVLVILHLGGASRTNWTWHCGKLSMEVGKIGFLRNQEAGLSLTTSLPVFACFTGQTLNNRLDDMFLTKC